jgi:cytoskeletal protein RodZ
MNKNTREEKTGKVPSNSEGLQPAEIEKDRDEDKNKKRGLLLRRITVVLAVLVVLSLLGLIGRALYLHFNDPADSEVTVPENHLESDDPGEETSPPDSDSAASESTEANGSAAEETDRKAAYTELFETNTVSNKKFEARNMLPGDSVSQYYCVRTFHKESLPVYFSVK